METSVVIFTILLFLGCLQGFIMGIILIRDDSVQKRSNKWLAVILFFFSYRLLAEALKFFDIGFFDFAYHITLEYNWIYGALLYFFVKSYVNPNFRLQKKDYIHFLPVAIEFLFSLFIKTQNFFWDGTRESLTWAGYWGYVLWMHTPFMYVIAGIILLFYARKAQQLLSTEEKSAWYTPIPENLKWVKDLLIVHIIYASLFTVIVIIDFLFFNYAFTHFGFYFPFIGLSIITYWMGLQGFLHRSKPAFKKKKLASAQNQESLHLLADRIKQAMEEEFLFKNPELSLQSLAEQLSVKPYLITECLNQVLGKKFNRYINEFRLEEVKRLLLNGNFDNYTLLGIAYEAGFNSKASFNRVVKQLSGLSPKELKASQLSNRTAQE